MVVLNLIVRPNTANAIGQVRHAERIVFVLVVGTENQGGMWGWQERERRLVAIVSKVGV